MTKILDIIIGLRQKLCSTCPNEDKTGCDRFNCKTIMHTTALESLFAKLQAELEKNKFLIEKGAAKYMQILEAKLAGAEEYIRIEKNKLTAAYNDVGEEKDRADKAEAELEKARAELDSVNAELGMLKMGFKPESKAEADNKHLREALEKLIQWSKAYPLEIFPKPDLVKAHRILKAGGMTLDAISAHNMRHVLEGVAKIATKALEKPSSEA